jgi:hypothetical protein
LEFRISRTSVKNIVVANTTKYDCDKVRVENFSNGSKLVDNLCREIERFYFQSLSAMRP